MPLNLQGPGPPVTSPVSQSVLDKHGVEEKEEEAAYEPDDGHEPGTHRAQRRGKLRLQVSRAASGERPHENGACACVPHEQDGHPTTDASDENAKDENEDGCDNEGGGEEEDQSVEVTWDDGEKDPENPRSMHKARRWLIVIVVSMGAFCV